MGILNELLHENFAVILLSVIGLIIILYYLVRDTGYISELNKKSVLITGCDTGFGHDLAKHLDKLGVTVFAGCLFPDGKGADALKAACSDKLHVLQLDVTKDDHIQDAVNYVKKFTGDKDLWAVVNNAGIFQPNLFEWTCIDNLKLMFDINSLGPLRVTKAFLPLLRTSKGRIVLVSSLADHIQLPVFGGYSMTKHATSAFAKALRPELRCFGISVHVIRPTAYHTPLTDDSIVYKSYENAWNNLSHEVRDTYGEKYVELLKEQAKFIKKYLVLPASSTYEVINSLLDATIGINPKFDYVPGLAAKLHNFLGYIIPITIEDLLKNMFLIPPPSSCVKASNIVNGKLKQ